LHNLLRRRREKETPMVKEEKVTGMTMTKVVEGIPMVVVVTTITVVIGLMERDTIKKEKDQVDPKERATPEEKENMGERVTTPEITPKDCLSFLRFLKVVKD
jgi:hypothetical protein